MGYYFVSSEIASMEPRSLERGNPGTILWANKAAQGLQWSHVHSNVETGDKSDKSILQIVLQWSHVHSNVETASGEEACIVSRTASMEPRSLERGNEVEATTQERAATASMEPRSLERGNSG